MKPSREEAEKLVGKRTALPQQRGAGALNDLPKAASKDEKPRSMGNLGDPLGLKKSLRDREKRRGLNLAAWCAAVVLSVRVMGKELCDERV